MSRHRARIVRMDPESTSLRAVRWITPAGASPLGYIARGDDEGRLLRLASGALVIQLPTGAIGTLDQRKVQAMLDGEGSQTGPDLPPLAAALKSYRAAQGLTQQQFADARGIPVARLRAWEAAATSPAGDLAQLTADLLRADTGKTS